MNSKETRWTDEMIDYLVSAYVTDTPCKQIAAALGKSHGAVREAARRYGLADKERVRRVASERFRRMHAEDEDFKRRLQDTHARQRERAAEIPDDIRHLKRKLRREGIPVTERDKMIHEFLRQRPEQQ